uniref:Uncharacterized protein n=1 Tax=Globisporangium ultimum (strain ATCC 200006 / CBS 805.95 / DAOM BR144) TaxID=431595 RepID=K3X3Q3_GLOUD
MALEGELKRLCHTDLRQYARQAAIHVFGCLSGFEKVNAVDL